MINTLHNLLAGLLAVLALAECAVSAEEPTQAQQEFFETRVRPVLVEHCYECHGSEKQWAELRLDSRTSILKGGESGPAAVPGNPEESRIVQVIRYSEDDSQMPPEGKLSDQQIADLTTWIAEGAAWPASSPAVEAVDYFEQAKTHWAYQPVTEPEVPAAPTGARTGNAVDHFIATKLVEKNLTQSPAAEPYQQLRRLAFDITGLPPSLEEMQKFQADPSDANWQQMVEQYLASSSYGEKWARHWLDLARYADTKGYVFTEERRYPFAYTYRDYVIKSLNEDLPYDRFIKEQLAADLLPEKRNEQALAALGFLTVGNRYLNRTPDIFDDRIDVTMRGLMGTTLACARCHDHKFDPLEAADYYALYGVFDSCVEPEQLPQIGESQDQAAYEKYVVEKNKLQEAADAYAAEISEKINQELITHIEHYFFHTAKAAKHESGQYPLEPKYEIRDRIVRLWERHLNRISLQDPIFGVWRRYVQIKPEDFAAKAPAIYKQIIKMKSEGKLEIHPAVFAEIHKEAPQSMYDVVKSYATVFKTALTKPEAERSAEDLLIVQSLEKSRFTPETVSGVYNRAERNHHRNLEKKVDALMATSPGAPPRAMVLQDKENPAKPYIFKRGNQGARGDNVDRRFLKVLDFVQSDPYPEKESGRLQLAEAIVDRQNPLTARVFVNRVWLLLIGKPLVENTSDFGLRTPLPSHPELLDYLSSRFMEENWSVKWLIREIVSSATYRQSSISVAENRKADPENVFVWRMNRKRIPFESMRDSMLDAAGLLDRTMYGRPVEIDNANPSHRRAIYGFIDRNNVSQLLRTFDVAGPNASVSERPRTTVPQQPLYLMNSPFVMDIAKQLVAKLDTSKPVEERVHALYRRLFQREAKPQEMQACAEYVNSHPDQANAFSELAQSLLLTNEFHFVD